MDFQQIPEEYYCPITQELMTNPVQAADGHTYEESAIKHWFQLGKSISPMTGSRLAHKSLNPNFALKKVIDQYKEKIPLVQRQNQIKTDLDLAVKLREEIIQDYVNKKIITKQETTQQDDGSKEKYLEKQLQLQNQKILKLEEKLTEFGNKMQEMQQMINQLLKNNINNNNKIQQSNNAIVEQALSYSQIFGDNKVRDCEYFSGPTKFTNIPDQRDLNQYTFEKIKLQTLLKKAKNPNDIEIIDL